MDSDRIHLKLVGEQIYYKSGPKAVMCCDNVRLYTKEKHEMNHLISQNFFQNKKETKRLTLVCRNYLECPSSYYNPLSS